MAFRGANPVPPAMKIAGSRPALIAEPSQWPFDLQHRALAQAAEQRLTEGAAGNVPHMQLKLAAGIRRIGHRIAAPPAALEQHIQVLPRLELHGLRRGHAQYQPHDIGA